MSATPDYTQYTDQELVDLYDVTDKGSSEASFQSLCEVMAQRGLLFKTFDNGYEFNDKGYYLSQASKVKPVPSYAEAPPTPKFDESGNYVPNRVPIGTRVLNSVLSLMIISYGGFGLWSNELWIPLARRTDSSITLSGGPAVLMFVAMICATLVMTTEIIDHYDTRENEHTYYNVASIFKYLGFATFGSAVVWGYVSNAVNTVV